MGLFEMHCHLLPDIDDSKVPTDGLPRVLEIYRECGFTGIVFTPHIYNPYVHTRTEAIRDVWERAKVIAGEKGLKVYLGSELFIGDQDPVRTIPFAGKYALVEFPTTLPLPGWYERLASLVEQGFTPMVAHVERYCWLSVDGPDFARIRKLGCLIQVNVEGVADGTALPYLEADVVDVMATDNHGVEETLPARLVEERYSWPKVFDRMEALGL